MFLLLIMDLAVGSAPSSSSSTSRYGTSFKIEYCRTGACVGLQAIHKMYICIGPYTVHLKRGYIEFGVNRLGDSGVHTLGDTSVLLTQRVIYY